MEKKRQFITNVIFYLIIAALVLVLCRYVLPVLVPFILGFLIAALVQIPVRKIGGNSPGGGSWRQWRCARSFTWPLSCCLCVWAPSWCRALAN